MKFNKNEFGWEEKVSVNTDELATKNDIPHYNETLMFEISSEDYNNLINNQYFNMNALNIDETKSYISKNIDTVSNQEYVNEFVYNRENDVLVNEINQIYIYNHKSYNGTNFVEDTNSAVITLGITPMSTEIEGYVYFRLYEVDKVELDNGCLSNDVSIKNSLTVGSRTGDIGECSVAEGSENTASGFTSHAEGIGATASGDYSHAEGNASTASGDNSHAEGYSTTASDYASHAEGGGTTASGTFSHAEGAGTTASGYASHAEGDNATVLGDSSHIEGKSSKSASSVIQNLSSSTTNDTIMTNWETSKFSLAKGNAYHVEGKDNLALGNYSHAEGNTTMASGNYSHAEGGSTKASGEYSHAEGMETKAIGHKSHAEGYYSTALGECSHAEGFSNSTANKQITNLSTTTSNTTIINAWKRVKFSLAKSNYSHVEGDSCLALDECSHAEGNRTIASNSYCHSEGDSTKATGNTSHAEGYKTEAMGDYSHVEGYSTIASGENSHAEGYYTKASGQQQHVQGKYNIVDTSYAHIVGNGTSETSRSNAHTLDWDGNAWYQGKLSQEGTPTEDKDLTTKKYVDDAIANQPQLSFDTEGNLVVTIGGVTKKFKEITE